MVKKRVVITDDGVEVLKENDRVVSVYPGSEPDEGPHVVVEREVPDEPAYEPGTRGTATIENNYGRAMPDQAGVWVSRAQGPQFVLFAVPAGRRAMYPASLVSDFVPDPTPAEAFETLTKDMQKAVSESRKWRRKCEHIDDAFKDLVSDLRDIRVGASGSPMRTASGAQMRLWVSRNLPTEEEL